MENLPESLVKSGALEIKNTLSLIDGSRILDVATESGDFIKTLMKTLRGYSSFVGVDISEKDWDAGNFADERVEFIEMNAENLEFEDESFDTVCISHGLHHLTDVNAVLAEMNRVLKPDGHFIVQESFRDGKQTEAQIIDVLIHDWDAEIDNLFGIPHNKTFTVRELKEIADNLGLKDVKAFESTHEVKCLFCDNKFVCDDPTNENLVKSALKYVDKNLARLQEYAEKNQENPDPKVKRLEEEGKDFRKRVKAHGNTPASNLFIIGRK